MNDFASDDATLTSEAFAVALESGIHRVILEQEHLNRINVFPVADGDTGTNLSLSLSTALPVVHGSVGGRIAALLAAVADALLDGARGNSGAIMAQFFQGLSDSAENLQAFDVPSFATAVELGSHYAHDAIAEPKPGTILSVIAAFAQSLKSHVAPGKGAGMRQALGSALVVAQAALKKTETELEALRKAGVVDAGARGFVVMVEGMFEYLAHGRKTDKPEIADLLVEAAAAEAAGVSVDLEFRYCTECMINGTDINRRKLREELSSIGNSLVIAGTKKKAKIHIHVNEPDNVFAIARRYGTSTGEKADDMRQQQSSSHDSVAKFAVITDSAADIPDTDLERLDIHMVPLRVQFGDRGYMDKVSISADEFFAELQNSPEPPTTSQPSPGDFRRQYQFLASHFADVISISLSGTVSGTYQAALSAAERVEARGDIHVLNTLNASLGQGLIAIFAAECAAAGVDAARTLEALKKLVPRTHTFALIRDMSHAVRGGRVPGYVSTLASMLRVTPVLRTKPDGRVSAAGALPGRKNALPRFARYVARKVNGDRPLRITIAHAVCAEEAETLRSLLREHLPGMHSCEIGELGAAIGVHGGPGCIVVGIQPFWAPQDVDELIRLS